VCTAGEICRETTRAGNPSVRERNRPGPRAACHARHYYDARAARDKSSGRVFAQQSAKDALSCRWPVAVRVCMTTRDDVRTLAHERKRMRNATRVSSCKARSAVGRPRVGKILL